MRRIRLAQPRRSPVGYILTVEIRLVSGKLLRKLMVADYTSTGVLLSVTIRALCMGATRIRLNYQGDEIYYGPYRRMFKLLKGNRSAQITCVVLPPENCTVCGAAAVLSGWKNLLTGLPEYHKKCRCYCCKYKESGWRTKRLWTQMVVAWHRSRNELAADADGL